MGRDEHPRVVPQAAVRIAHEFPTVNVERGPTDSAVGQPLQKGGLVDDLSSSHVDHHGTGLCRGDRRAVDEALRLRRQLAADGYEVALGKQRVQAVARFHPADAFRQGLAGHGAPTGAHHAHPHRYAEPRYFAPDPAEPDDADGLTLEQPRSVGPRPELVARPVRCDTVKPLGEVENRGEYVLGHGNRVPQTTGRRHPDVASPQITGAQVARPSWDLMEPLQAWRANAKVHRERERP